MIEIIPGDRYRGIWAKTTTFTIESVKDGYAKVDGSMRFGPSISIPIHLHMKTEEIEKYFELID